MEQLNESQDYTVYELPLERIGDPDVSLMSTGKPILTKNMTVYQDLIAKAHSHEQDTRSYDKAIALGAAGAMAFAIFAAVRNRRNEQ